MTTQIYSGMIASSSKRARIEGVNETMSSFQAYKGTEGALSVIGQRFDKKSKWGKKRTLLQKMIDYYKASQNSYIARFQRLSRFNDAISSTALSNDYNDTSKKLSLPMYALNLTSLPLNRIAKNSGGVDNSVVFPFYRLAKDTVTNAYQWDYLPTVNGNKDGVQDPSGWQIEWDALNGSPPVQVNKYCYEWADVKLAFTGCNRPVKIHLALMKFRVGPLRKYYYGEISTQGAHSVDETIDETIAWDSFWANKISNPIRTSRKPSNYNDNVPWRIVKHESFVLGQDSADNLDTKNLQAVYTKFMDVGKVFYCDSPNFTVAQSGNVVGDTTQGAAFGYVGINATDTTLQTTSFNFPPSDKDTWFVIWADVYDQYKRTDESGLTGSYPDGVDNLYKYAPSFDINVRAKYSYND